jgi:5'-nucleotidase/2',3'-cyclic-nucleotide 2'-phosphodiesterase/3'-nucleotidase/5'-nucleotidase
LEFSTDTIVVLNLTGSQIKQAFERSLSQYPQENTSFLQISGFEVTFNQKVKPGSRVVKITADGAPLDEKHTYTVAMPLLLGNGIGGYFKIWRISQLARSIDNKTMESVLSGKPYVATSPRWLAQ